MSFVTTILNSAKQELDFWTWHDTAKLMKRNTMRNWFVGLGLFVSILNIENISYGQAAFGQPKPIWHFRQRAIAAPGFYVVSSSPDGRLIAARDRDNSVFMLDLEQQKKWYEFKGHETNWIESIAFSPDRNRFLTAAGSGEKLKVWRASNGELELEVPTTTAWANFSDKGEQIIALGSSKVEYFDFPGGLARGVSGWQLSGETAVAMSKDGKLVVMYRRLNPQVYAIELLNLQSKLRIGLPGDTARPTQIVISNDKQWIAGVFENGNRLHLWNSTDPRDRHYVLDGHGGIIGSIAFSDDGRFLISADGERKIFLWDVLTRQVVREFETEQTAVRSLVFLPNSFQIAVGGITDQDSSIWIADLWSVIFKSKMPRPESIGVAFKRLGSTTATTSLDAASALIEHFEYFQPELRKIVFDATYAKASEDLAGLLSQLGDREFSRREQATLRLVERFSHFEVPLRKLIKDENLPIEQRYRIRRILMNRPRIAPINVEVVRRWMRLMLVLEMVRTTGSLEMLERIATGHPDNEISSAASATLERLNSRRVVR